MANSGRFLVALYSALLALSSIVTAGDADTARYDNFRLYRVLIETQAQVEMLRQLEEQSDCYSFMGHANHPNQNLTIMVSPHKIAEITELLSRYNLQGTILLYNMQELIDKEQATIKPKNTPPEEFSWQFYHHLDTINDWLRYQVSRHANLQLLELNASYENRTLYGVKLSKDPSNSAIVVECGIHAREWISPASCTFVLNELLSSDREEVRHLADSYNWIIFPVVNPDGYQYTFEGDRLWRKNTKPYGICRGVDLNRNFASDWNGPGASSDPCRYDFCGASAASEPETQALTKFLIDAAGNQRIRAYFSIHSFSQLVMFPYGFTVSRVPNYDDLLAIGRKGTAAIERTHGTRYVCGAMIETIYPSSGDSVDWVYNALGVPLAYTFELRGPPDSTNMFVLPAKEIIPTSEELLAAFIAMLEESARKMSGNTGPVIRALFAIILITTLPVIKGDAAGEGAARYDNYRLYRVELATDEHVQLFQQLEAKSDSCTFYGHARQAGQQLTIMVSASKVADFEDLLTLHAVQGRVLERNVQQLIDREAATVKPVTTEPGELGWEHYYQLETIYAWMDKLAEQHAAFVSIVEIGRSYEGRPIKGVKLSRRPDRKAIVVEGGIHAREWISPATATFLLNQLITSTEPSIVELSTAYDWFFFPIVNPDGYRFTFTGDRLWRKNRKPYGLCRGVDLNRNFDSNWGGVGSSDDPCSYDFSGSSAFSEPESVAIAEFLRANVQSARIRTYIALHSYSQLLMFPYGHTEERVANYDHLKSITEKAIAALTAVNGTEFRGGSKYETIYPSSGGSIDWAYRPGGVPVSLTFELRGPPDSTDMFILPAEQILPVGMETLAAFVAIVREAARLGYYDD
uniref:Zinc carboxypeptidase A 1 n=1 Tax=Anopheles dirus TaxID=7168 RepID=A0A182N406_9DIPT